MSIAEIKLTIGALQVAVIITGYLLGCSAVQTYVYYKNFPKDLQRIQHLVSTLMILETAQQICLIHTVYVLSIENWGSEDALLKLPGSFAAAVVLHVCDAFLVENFYFWRIYKLTGRSWPSVTASVLSAVRFCGWMLFAAEGTKLGFASPSLSQSWMWLIVTLLVGIFLSNGFISMAILWFLCLNRSNALSSTRQLLDQLITWTIETCLITELFYAAAIVLYLTVKNSFIWLVVLACGVKISSNCLLSSLNNRPTQPENAGIVTLGQDVPLDTHDSSIVIRVSPTQSNFPRSRTSTLVSHK